VGWPFCHVPYSLDPPAVPVLISVPSIRSSPLTTAVLS
jgi:hypothetical protein